MSIGDPTMWERFNPSDPALLAIAVLERRAAILDVMFADNESNLGPDTYERLQQQINQALCQIIKDELASDLPKVC